MPAKRRSCAMPAGSLTLHTTSLSAACLRLSASVCLGGGVSASFCLCVFGRRRVCVPYSRALQSCAARAPASDLMRPADVAGARHSYAWGVGGYRVRIPRASPLSATVFRARSLQLPPPSPARTRMPHLWVDPRSPWQRGVCPFVIRAAPVARAQCVHGKAWRAPFRPRALTHSPPQPHTTGMAFRWPGCAG
jgi:hypothetical protein